MEPIVISKQTERRFVLGRQGLWPGRRWAGKAGTTEALRTMEALQLDPLNVVARCHHLALWGRVDGYKPEFFDQTVYQERCFFDYGGGLFVYPMEEFPYWQPAMKQAERGRYWRTIAKDHPEVVEAVLERLRAEGPLGNRDFNGTQRVNSYRGRKDTALALYYLWLTGAVMIHHRDDFQRIYDLRERVVPPQHDWAASEAEAAEYFARKNTAFRGVIRELEWKNVLAGVLDRPVSPEEARERLERLVDEQVLAPAKVEGSKDRWYVLASDLPVLTLLEAGEIPDAWQPLGTTTLDEAVFLAPLEITTARGRARRLFDFDYVWEVYKPAHTRRWGYYTLPILYGDRLAARVDPKLERSTNTLVVKGFWLEASPWFDPPLAEDPAFAAALGRGFARFAAFLKAQCLNLAALEPAGLRRQVAASVRSASSNAVEVVAG
jgi:uncharacterized protein YcaQ